MVTLPSAIAGGRVWIVTPNVTIRDLVFEAVESVSKSCFWRTMGVAIISVEGPYTAIIDGPDTPWDERFSFVHTLKTENLGKSWWPLEKELKQPPRRFLRQFRKFWQSYVLSH